MTTPGQLDALERVGRPLRRVLHGEDVITLKAAADMPYGEVLRAMEDPEAFSFLVIEPEQVTSEDGESVRWQWPPISVWQTRVLQQEWIVRNDLGGVTVARRLMYLVDRYWPDLEHDLLTRAGIDLAPEWQARRWRRLLDSIDRLPSDSFYQESIAVDEEHMKLIVEANAKRGDKGSTAPRMSTWSPMMAKLTEIADLISIGNINVIKMNSKPGSATPRFQPGERPESIYAKLEHDRRQAAHEALADRLLRRGVFADQPQS